ncbi:MAG: thioredoxin family protein [Candidatus Falkowbacteria bacterium]
MSIQSIQVLGSGCPTCKQLYEATKKVAEELKIDVIVEYITDVTKMIEMGVMQSPVLAVNGKPVLTGGGHGEEEIKNAIGKNLSSNNQPSGGCCSCGGNC